jgi:hypothetical protein
MRTLILWKLNIEGNMENQWPKGYEPPLDFEKMGNMKSLILQELKDQQEDRAIFSKLQDQLAGQDQEADDLLREIDCLQLEIIAGLSRELLNG